MGNTESPIETVPGGATDGLRPGQDWQTDEALVLLSMLNLALTNIDMAMTNRNKEAAAPCLMRAVDTYGRVKSLLPKLDLRSELVALVHERLEVVRRLIWTGPIRPADN